MHKYIKHTKKIHDPKTKTMKCCYHREGDISRENYVCRNVNGSRKFVKVSTKTHTGGNDDKAKYLLGLKSSNSTKSYTDRLKDMMKFEGGNDDKLRDLLNSKYTKENVNALERPSGHLKMMRNVDNNFKNEKIYKTTGLQQNSQRKSMLRNALNNL